MTLLPQSLTNPISSYTPSLHLLNNDLSSDDGYDDLSNINIPEYPRKSGKWTTEEDELLRRYVDTFGEKQWRKISHHIPGRTSIQCLHRWSKILRPGLVKGPWTPEEDQKLIAWIKAEGPNKWANAANIIPGRSGKQCRERWFNNLNPDVKKTEWTKEEDELIFDLYQKHGSSWSKIAKFVPGRTENSIKNRFYSTLRKIEADRKKNRLRSTPSEHSNPAEDGPGDEEEDSSKQNEDNMYPHTLYKLLQNTMPQEEEREEEVQQQKEQEESNSQIKSAREIENPQNSQPASVFNFNGEKILIRRDGSITKKASDDLQNEKDISCQEDFQTLLLNVNPKLKERSVSTGIQSAQKNLDSILMLNLIQKQAADLNRIKALNNNFRPLFNNNANLSSFPFHESQIPNLSHMPLTKGLRAPIRQNSNDLSTLVELRLGENQNPRFSDIGNPLNGFEFAPLRVLPRGAAGFKNPQPLNFNVPSRLSPRVSPLKPHIRTSLLDRSDSQPNSGLLRALQTTKEMSQSSQSTQGSIFEANEGLLHNPGQINELLMAMGNTVRAPSAQQNNLNALLNAYNGIPSIAHIDQNEARMQTLFSQLNSLEGLVPNVKGQLVHIENLRNERSMLNLVPGLNAEVQRKRMLMEMLKQNSLNQGAMFEMDSLVKKARFDQFN